MTVLRRPRISTCLFDLDDALYENTTMQHHVAENIRRAWRAVALRRSCIGGSCRYFECHPFLHDRQLAAHFLGTVAVPPTSGRPSCASAALRFAAYQPLLALLLRCRLHGRAPELPAG